MAASSLVTFRNNTSLKNDTMTIAGNFNDTLYEWEYYYDYIDPVIVDESKLKYNKYSIVIILWISLAAFVGFLFLTLNLMSLSGKLPKTRKVKRHHRASTASPEADL